MNVATGRMLELGAQVVPPSLALTCVTLRTGAPVLLNITYT